MFNGPIGKKMMIEQGSVPPECSLDDKIAGPLIWTEINAGRSPCWGCDGDRSTCHGKPKQTPDPFGEKGVRDIVTSQPADGRE